MRCHGCGTELIDKQRLDAGKSVVAISCDLRITASAIYGMSDSPYRADSSALFEQELLFCTKCAEEGKIPFVAASNLSNLDR